MATEHLNLWCIRHGERLEDTEANAEYESKYEQSKLFDLPLSDFGIEHAYNLAVILEKNRFTANDKKPKYIYTSPMLRTIQTAFEICKILEIDMVIVPSLSLGAHIVKENGLKFTDSIHNNLVLANNYIENVQSNFLTKKEIMSQFNCKQFNIHFMDIIHKSLNECIVYLIDQKRNDKYKTIICITHREKDLDFKIDHNQFQLKRNVFGIVDFKRKKANPIHCEMFKYKLINDEIWYNGKLEDM